jgi:hypothetical protein
MLSFEELSNQRLISLHFRSITGDASEQDGPPLLKLDQDLSIGGQHSDDAKFTILFSALYCTSLVTRLNKRYSMFERRLYRLFKSLS